MVAISQERSPMVKMKEKIFSIAGRVYTGTGEMKNALVDRSIRAVANVFAPDASGYSSMSDITEKPTPYEIELSNNYRRVLSNRQDGYGASVDTLVKNARALVTPRVAIPTMIGSISVGCAGASAVEVPLVPQPQAQVVQIQEGASTIGGELPVEIGTAATLPVVVNTPLPTETRKPTATQSPTQTPTRAAPTEKPTAMSTEKPTPPPFTSAEARKVLGMKTDTLLVGTECKKINEDEKQIEDIKCEVALAPDIKLGANSIPLLVGVVGSDTQWALQGGKPVLSKGDNGEKIVSFQLQLLKPNSKLSLQAGSSVNITIDENGNFNTIVKIIAHSGQRHTYKAKIDPKNAIEEASINLDVALTDMYEDVGITFQPGGSSGDKFHGRKN